MLQRKTSNIAPFVEHPVYSIFKVENILNLVSWFSFNTSCKTYLFLCFTKEALILSFLWKTLYIALPICTVSWFLTVGFTLSLVAEILCVKRFYCESIMVILFWGFFMLDNIFLSPQVKRSMIISKKHSI